MKVNVIPREATTINAEPNSMEEKKGFVVSGGGEAVLYYPCSDYYRLD
jgi:hypothetical protein